MTSRARSVASRSNEIHFSPSNLSRYVPAINPGRLRFPLASVSPLRVEAPETVTRIPANVSPLGSGTVIAIPARLAVAGARRGCAVVGVAGVCVAGAGVVGAGAVGAGAVGAGFGWLVPCCGLAGVLGACAPAVTILT